LLFLQIAEEEEEEEEEEEGWLRPEICHFNYDIQMGATLSIPVYEFIRAEC